MTNSGVDEGASTATTQRSTHPTGRTRAAHSPNIALPLWIAAIGLAVIAVVMIVGVFELRQALQSTQASVQQLQEQI